MNQIRIAKLLANWGYGTRNQARKLMREGRVTLNGVPVVDTKAVVGHDGAGLAVDGEPASWRPDRNDARAAKVEELLREGLHEEVVFEWATSQGCSKRSAARLIGYFMRPDGPLRQRRVALTGQPARSPTRKAAPKGRNVVEQEAIDEAAALLSMGYSEQEARSLMGTRCPVSTVMTELEEAERAKRLLKRPAQSRRARQNATHAPPSALDRECVRVAEELFMSGMDEVAVVKHVTAMGLPGSQVRRLVSALAENFSSFERHGFPDDLPSREVLDAILDEVSAAYSIRRGSLERRLPKGWTQMRADDLRGHLEALAGQSKGPQKTATREELLAVVHRVAVRFGVPVGAIQCKMPKGWLRMSPDKLDSVMTEIARDAGADTTNHEVPLTPALRPHPAPASTRGRLTHRKALEEAARLLVSGHTAEEVRAHFGSGAPSLGDLHSLQQDLSLPSGRRNRKPIEEAADLLAAGWSVEEVAETVGTRHLSLDELRNLEADLHSSGSSGRKRRKVIRRRRAVSASASAPSSTKGRPLGVARSPVASDGARTSRASSHARKEPVERPTADDEFPELPPGWEDL